MRIRVLALVLLYLMLPLAAAAAELAGLGSGEAKAADLWRPLGPGGGFATHIAADPRVPGGLFAVWHGTGFPEVYRRDPGKETWSLANRGLENTSPVLLALDPARRGILWAATVNPLKIYQSTDAGASWKRRFTGQSLGQPFGLWTLRRGRATDLIGWFGPTLQEAALFRSPDEGKSWTEIPGLRGPVAVQEGTSTAFAIGEDGRGLFMSQDGGTWSPAGTLPVDADQEPVLALIALSGGQPVLLVSFAESGLFRSLNRGATWSLVGPAGPGPSSLVAVRGEIFAAFASGLYRSQDGGATWQLQASPGFPAGFVSLASDRSAGTLYAVSRESGVISQSRNGGQTWSRVPPRGVQQFLALEFAWHPVEPRVQALVSRLDSPTGLIYELGTTNDSGATWRRSDMQAFAFDPDDPTVLYGGSDAGTFVSQDNGLTWTSLRSEETSALAHSRSALLAGGCGIARSDDAGSSWTEALPCELPPNAQFPLGGSRLVQRLIAHPTDPDVIWAEILEYFNNGEVAEAAAVLYGSFDGGSTWVRRDLRSDLYEPRIALSPALPNTVWEFGRRTILRSEDRGLTWRHIPAKGTLHDLAIHPTDGDFLVSVGDRAVVSRDGGKTWKTAFSLDELAPWGSNRRFLARVFLHPLQPGRIAAAPFGGGLLVRRAPI